MAHIWRSGQLCALSSFERLPSLHESGAWNLDSVRLVQTWDRHLTNPGLELTSHFSVRMEHRGPGWSSVPEPALHLFTRCQQELKTQAESYPEGGVSHGGWLPGRSAYLG